jgi:hypothetical protein
MSRVTDSLAMWQELLEREYPGVRFNQARSCGGRNRFIDNIKDALVVSREHHARAAF